MGLLLNHQLHSGSDAGMHAPSLAFFLLSFCVLPWVPGVGGFSRGAPENRCGDMIPNHALAAGLSGPTPFYITVSANTYQADSSLQVSIFANASHTIKGFLLQARPAANTEGNVQLGAFTPVQGTQTLCQGRGLTHAKVNDADLVPLPSFTVTWSPQGALQGDLIFRATVVESYNFFYTRIDSSVITATTPSTSEAPPTASPATQQAPSDATPESSEAGAAPELIAAKTQIPATTSAADSAEEQEASTKTTDVGGMQTPGVGSGTTRDGQAGNTPRANAPNSNKPGGPVGELGDGSSRASSFSKTLLSHLISSLVLLNVIVPLIL